MARAGRSLLGVGLLLALLGLLVLAGHALMLAWLGDELARAAEPVPAMKRIEAIYTRVVAQSAPPTGPPVAVAPPRKPARAANTRPVPPKAAASAPVAAASAAAAEPAASAASANEDVPDTRLAATEPDQGASAAAPAETPVSAPSPAASAASAVLPGMVAAPGPAFTWPTSTKLKYVLSGWYQGEVHGSGQVEWLRADDRYQVHLEIVVGPTFAPMLSRRMSSEGRITATGLRPQRFEQDTRILGSSRRVQMPFGDNSVQLQNGQSAPFQPGVQDSASQFIQMVYLFSTRPALRAQGGRVDFDLALPHRVQRWVYQVVEPVRLQTPLGELDTFHVRPMYQPPPTETRLDGTRSGGSILSAQVWFAPTLQMLPVRIRIEQDAQTWIELHLAEAPQQAAQ